MALESKIKKNNTISEIQDGEITPGKFQDKKSRQHFDNAEFLRNSGLYPQ